MGASPAGSLAIVATRLAQVTPTRPSLARQSNGMVSVDHHLRRCHVPPAKRQSSTAKPFVLYYGPNCAGKLDTMLRLRSWIGNMLACSALLVGVNVHGARSSHTRLTVTVRPAVAMSRQGEDTIGVKIRLAPQAQARLWRDETCGAPPQGAYLLSQSGTYTVPLSRVDGSGSLVCLSSSDGSLHAALSLAGIAK